MARWLFGRAGRRPSSTQRRWKKEAKLAISLSAGLFRRTRTTTLYPGVTAFLNLLQQPAVLIAVSQQQSPERSCRAAPGEKALLVLFAGWSW